MKRQTQRVTSAAAALAVTAAVAWVLTSRTVQAQHDHDHAGHDHAPAASAPAASPPSTASLKLSPELKQLLIAEMQAIEGAMQHLVKVIPAGDWPAVATTATAIERSFILAKKLTEEQKHELHRAPKGFLSLDGEFHQEAGRLASAAKANDSDKVREHFAALLDGCVTCHAQFASSCFPGHLAQKKEVAKEEDGHAGHHH